MSSCPRLYWNIVVLPYGDSLGSDELEGIIPIDLVANCSFLVVLGLGRFLFLNMLDTSCLMISGS